MDAQQFLAEFAHIANAPGGVANPPNLSLTPCKPYLDVVSHGV